MEVIPNVLSQARQGRRAAKRLLSQTKYGQPTRAEVERLVEAILDGFNAILRDEGAEPDPPPEPPRGRPSLNVIWGGRKP